MCIVTYKYVRCTKDNFYFEVSKKAKNEKRQNKRVNVLRGVNFNSQTIGKYPSDLFVDTCPFPNFLSFWKIRRRPKLSHCSRTLQLFETLNEYKPSIKASKNINRSSLSIKDLKTDFATMIFFWCCTWQSNSGVGIKNILPGEAII